MGPRNFDNAMDLTLMVEDKLRVSAGRRTGPYSFSKSAYQPSNASTAWFSQKGSPTQSSTGSISPRSYAQSSQSTARSGGEVRRLSDAELQSKREKGMCYRCDDKWSVGHKCKRKELSVLLTCEGEEEEPELSPHSS